MAGKHAVILAMDSRAGLGNLMISVRRKPVLQLNGHTLVGLCGSDAAAHDFMDNMLPWIRRHGARFQAGLASPRSVATMVSNQLYAKRDKPYLCEPIVVGLDEREGPFISCMDCLGAETISSDFAAAGSAGTSLYGICEMVYKPGMETPQLLRTVQSVFTSAIQRNCMSGGPIFVYTITRDGIHLKEFSLNDGEVSDRPAKPSIKLQ
jgi:20S proteasome subunit beta 3